MFIRKILGYWILVPAITGFIALLVYFKGADLHPLPSYRVGVVVLIGLVVLLARAPLTWAWRLVARQASDRSANRHDRDPAARVGAARTEASADLGSYRARSLRESLRDRHGWRWRYRDRWVLVAGDEPIVNRLAPGLSDAGYVVRGDTVLLYARQSGNALDTSWLDQIRRLRRRRPIDAIVAVTRNRSSAHAPFDADTLSQRLARHARAALGRTRVSAQRHRLRRRNVESRRGDRLHVGERARQGRRDRRVVARPHFQPRGRRRRPFDEERSRPLSRRAVAAYFRSARRLVGTGAANRPVPRLAACDSRPAVRPAVQGAGADAAGVRQRG